MRRIIVAAIIAAAGLCRAAEVPLGHPEFRPSPQHPVGYRGDWTGRYPAADPPVEWSIHYNVIWKMPVGNGEASPILVADRLFILSDGVRLACLDKHTGAVIWQHEHHARPDVAEEALVWRLEENAILHHRARPHVARIRHAEGTRVNLERDAERTGKPADPARLAAARQQLDEAQRQAAVFQQQQAKLDLDPKEALGCTTYAIATPCSDGRFVYAYLPLGAVVCYDLDGKRQWLRLLGERRVGGGWGGAQVGPSPLLADGKLIIHYDKFYGLDAATGKVLWQTPTRGLPIPSPVAGRRGDAWYAMMGNGQMLRLSDGKIVFDPPWKQVSTVQSPIFYDDMFCWIGAAVRLPRTPADNAAEAWLMAPRDLEQVDAMRPDSLTGPKPMLGWHGYSCPVYDQGLVYYQAEHGRFSAFEAATGKLVFNTTFPCRGEIYPGATLAGDRIFVGNRGGHMLVVARGTGAGHRVVAQNQLSCELGGNMPVFDGRRFFLRMTPRPLRGGGDPGSEGGVLFCIGDPLAPPPRPDPAPADPATLVKQLDAAADLEAYAAARALRGLGEKGAALVPELARRLDGADPRRVRLSLLALRALGPAAKEAAPRIIPLLGSVPYGASAQLDLYRSSRDALRAIGAETVPALVQSLKSPSREWGWHAHGVGAVADLLAELGPAAKPAIPMLTDLLRTGAQPQMRAAFTVLKALDPDGLGNAGVKALADRAREQRPTGEKRTALDLLASLGPAAASAIPAIEAAAKDANPDIAKSAAAALEKVRAKP